MLNPWPVHLKMSERKATTVFESKIAKQFIQMILYEETFKDNQERV